MCSWFDWHRIAPQYLVNYGGAMLEGVGLVIQTENNQPCSKIRAFSVACGRECALRAATIIMIYYNYSILCIKTKSAV